MTSAVKHTPGPWHVHATDRMIHVYSDGPERVADVYCPLDRDGHILANARLIAAAPLLLEALEFMVVRGVWNIDCQVPSNTSTPLPAYMNPAIVKARAAIKAATEAR